MWSVSEVVSLGALSTIVFIDKIFGEKSVTPAVDSGLARR